MIQWVRSFFFVVQMYLAIPIYALVFSPWALVSRRGAFACIHAYCAYVIWTARWMVNLRADIRGPLPDDQAVMIAAKHQSFFDIILIASATPEPYFIMKKSLKYAPFLGWYSWRMGCVRVDRGKRGRAIESMVAGVAERMVDGGQLVIYPQGTRVAVGVKQPYKIGAGVIQERTGLRCIPVATNVGYFWPRMGIHRKAGVAVVEFLPPMPEGLDATAFIEELETRIETASDRLLEEARAADRA